MINSLQILLHTPAINVNMPGNVAGFMGNMIEITQFKLIPEDYLSLMYLWKYGTEEDPIQENFFKKDENTTADGRRRLKELDSSLTAEQIRYREQRLALKDKAISDYGNSRLNDIGYGSVLIVENLQTLLAMIMIYVLLWVFVAIFYVFSLMCKSYFEPIMNSLAK